jgi:flagellar FliL protein
MKKKKTEIDLIKLDSQKDQTSLFKGKDQEETSPTEVKRRWPKLKVKFKFKLKKKFILIGGGIGFIFLVGAIGAGGYLGYIPMPKLSQSKISAPPKAASKEMGPVLKLSPLVVNLKEESGRSYLKTTIVLELESDKVGEEIKSRMSLLTDRVISVLSDKMLEEMRPSASKEQLKQELLSNLNQLFESPKIKGIYFDEFLYQ